MAPSRFQEIERTLFGATGDAAGRLMATDWAPDTPSRYCHRCGGSVGTAETDVHAATAACSACRDRRLAWDAAVRIGIYDGPLRDAIHALKFSGSRRSGVFLGRALGEQMQRRVPSDLLQRAVLVPVPTTNLRRLSRNHGVDHTLQLARAASIATGLPVVRLLSRVTRPPQATVPPLSRKQNVRGAFSLRRGQTLPRDRVPVLIDDIRTTGSTLTACCKALKTLDGGLSTAMRRTIVVATIAVAGEGRREPTKTTVDAKN